LLTGQHTKLMTALHGPWRTAVPVTLVSIVPLILVFIPLQRWRTGLAAGSIK
jgi:ABC-type glycerol-3-phosphate transport system permease component